MIQLELEPVNNNNYNNNPQLITFLSVSRHCSKYVMYVTYFSQQFYEVNTITNFPFIFEDTQTQID